MTKLRKAVTRIVNHMKNKKVPSNLTLKSVLASDYWLKIYFSFLKRIYCEESLIFYLSVVNYEKIEGQKLRNEQGNFIWKTHIHHNAIYAIALSYELRNELILVDRENSYQQDTFQEAKSFILSLLETNMLQQFIRESI